MQQRPPGHGLGPDAVAEDDLVTLVRSLDDQGTGRLPVAEIGHQITKRHGGQVAQETAEVVATLPDYEVLPVSRSRTPGV